MLCKKCGNQVGDGKIFCPHCGIMLDGVGYPEAKEQLNEDLFTSVYYGPDYYINTVEDEDLKEGEKKVSLPKIKGWLFRKGNKL